MKVYPWQVPKGVTGTVFGKVHLFEVCSEWAGLSLCGYAYRFAEMNPCTRAFWEYAEPEHRCKTCARLLREHEVCDADANT